MKEKHIQRNEKIKNNSEKFFQKVIRTLKIDWMLRYYLEWADKNRMKAYIFTNLFLLFFVILLFVMRPSSKHSSIEELGNLNDSIHSNLDQGDVKQNVSELFDLYSIQKELAALKSKEKLTPEDTARVRQLYLMLRKKDHSIKTH